MKNQTYLYLAIFAILSTLFTFMFYKNQNKFLETKIVNETKKNQDTIIDLRNKMVEANYFALENNQNAQNYLEQTVSDDFYPVSKVIDKIKETLMNENHSKEGNKYIEFPQIGEQKFIINKIKVVNHRWIIADFSNGQLWGEVWLRYFIEEDNSITFEVKDSFLYPN